MKRYLAAALAVVLALTLVSCDAYAKEGDTPSSSGLPDTSVQEEIISAILPEDSFQPEEPDHDHQLAQGDNIVPHDMPGYCGNTITEISSGPLMDGGEVSFWGGDSVALTDLLRYLDYSGEMCKCLPEYEVKTEFSEERYGVSLTEGYARHGGGQAALTQEQVELIQGILDRNQPD